jgi:hypothetical protein
MQFIPSRREILRRKIAFTSLMASLTTGMLLFAYLFDVPLPPLFWLVYIVLFSMIGFATFPFLLSLSKRRMTLTQTEILFPTVRTSAGRFIEDIRSIAIKRRRNGIIREIRIRFRDGKSMVLSAYEEQFELLKETLDNHLQHDVERTERFERFDYDHPLFYPGLGFLLSGGFIAFTRTVATHPFNSSKIPSFAVSGLLTFLGVYFILARPIGSQLDKNRFAVDLTIGIALLLGALFCLIASLI